MPPDEAHTPIASTQRGSGIWSESCRSTGAILLVTRPATIIRSAWRGEARKTSMPNRARSYRPAPDAIISMAQQARPNVAGHSDDLRVQLTSFSTLVSRTPLGSFSSSPIGLLLSVPFQSTPPPDVGVRDEHGDDEDDHLDQPEDAQRLVVHGPRVEEDDLDVEDDEEHRRQVVLDREAAPGEGLVDRLDAALVGLELGPVVPARPDVRGGGDREQRERRGQGEEPDDRDVVREHQRHPTVRTITFRAGPDRVRSVLIRV